jgi:hypothetical protein
MTHVFLQEGKIWTLTYAQGGHHVTAGISAMLLSPEMPDCSNPLETREAQNKSLQPSVGNNTANNLILYLQHPEL